MQSLQIRTGTISLDIIGDDGESRGIFRFNPQDVHTAKVIFSLSEELETKQHEYEMKAEQCETTEEKIELLNEVVDYFEGLIDNTFGSGSSELLFGDAKTLSMFEDFFLGIIPYYEDASKKRMNEQRKQLKAKKNGK